jgi:hypothetical protein
VPLAHWRLSGLGRLCCLRWIEFGRSGYWGGKTAPASRSSCLGPRAGHGIGVDGRLSSLVWRLRIISMYRS